MALTTTRVAVDRARSATIDEVARVLEVHGGLHHVLQICARLLQRAAHGLDAPAGLLLDRAREQVAVLVLRHLARDEDEIAGADRGVERQIRVFLPVRLARHVRSTMSMPRWRSTR